VFSIVTLALDGSIILAAYWQVRALKFLTTTGVIISSRLEEQESRGRDGFSTHTYSAVVKYQYFVAGKAYSGDRYRYGLFFNGTSAQQIVNEHPAGKKVGVYYNPKNPADSLLRPGLEGADLFGTMFLLPFNLIPLGILALIGRRTWSRCFGYRGAGTKVWDDGLVVRVRLPPVPPSFYAAVAAGMLAFFGLFPLLIFYGGPYAPISVMYHVWAVILVSVPVVYVLAACIQSRGAYDLAIDAIAGTVSLPCTRGRKRKVLMPLQEITSVEVRAVELPGSHGGFLSGYIPTLVLTDADGTSRAKVLVQWNDPRRAEALAAWLRQRLKCGG
jgi:hypothetical protein